MRDVQQLLAGITSFYFEDALSNKARALARLYGPSGDIEVSSKRIIDLSKDLFTQVDVTLVIWDDPTTAPRAEERDEVVGVGLGKSPEVASLAGRTVYRGMKGHSEYLGLFPARNAMMLFTAPKSLDLDPWKLGLDRVVLAILDEAMITSDVKLVAPDVLAEAARATLKASTGRFLSKTSVINVPDVPSGPLLHVFGTYDIDRRLSEFRYVFGPLGLRGGGLPAGTRSEPHVRMIFKGMNGYVSSPALPGGGWEALRLGDAIDRVGPGAISDVGNLSVPPLLDVLMRPRDVGAIVEDDRTERSVTYRATLHGRGTARLLSVGTLVELIRRLGADRLKELLDMQVPVSMTVDEQGRIKRGWVDLSPLIRRLSRAAAARRERDDVPPIVLRSVWTFEDVGKPLDIPFPPDDAPRVVLHRTPPLATRAGQG